MFGSLGCGTVGPDLNHVDAVSSGKTAATLAQALSAVSDSAAADAWDQPGDTHVVRLSGQSLGGMDAVYLVIEDGTHPTTYDATEDLLILLGGLSSSTLELADFQ